MLCPLDLAFFNAGSNIAASIDMIAITTNNSIRVNPILREWVNVFIA